MIPEKLYLPTSTLNFNSIMSSESISPASFYSKRGFGYKRFEKVNPNNLDNRIILYPKYPAFDIDDKELENYPMVIEVETKTLKGDIIKEIDGLFYTNETIYLNPFSTKIIFRNNSEKATTISKADPSIETKMVSVYKNSFTAIDNETNINSFKWERSIIEDSKNDISKYISEDRKINKLKGLLYAYLIASKKSVSQDIISLKKYTRNLHNTLSAIITSPDNRATYSQEEQLKTIYGTINNKLLDIFLLPVIKEKSEKYQCDFCNLLKKENLWDNWLRQNNYSKNQVSQFFAPSKEKEKALNDYIHNFESQISSYEHSQKKANCDITCLPVLQFKRIISIPEQKEFLVKLLNEYLEEAHNSEEFIHSRYEFAKSGGKIFKDELQEKWDGSPWQQYINALLKNLNEFSSFNLKSIKNITLESFAAFCQKGDSDIEKLEDYLISNEIGDFRIAFSLWGIIFGFANMPKTITNDFFLTNNLDYIANIYRHIFNQLHGVEIDGSFKQIPINKKPIERIINTPTTQPIKEVDQSTNQLPDNQNIKQKLKDCNLKPEQLDSISDIYEKNRFLVNDKFFTYVKKIRGIGNKTIERIKEALEYKESEISKSTHTETSLFEEMKPELGKEFYNDSSVWFYIETLVPKNSQKKVKTEIDWIQNVHKVDGYKKKSGEWVSLSDHSNNSVIKHFENNAKNRIDSKLLEKIVTKLNELYS